MAEILIATSDNPTIHYEGSVNFGKNHFCQWFTTDGSTDICTIQNSSLENKLTIVVSGAPATMMTTDGKPFNGQHSIPPNNPTSNVTAFGNFKGKRVTIFNNSALTAVCLITTVGGEH